MVSAVGGTFTISSAQNIALSVVHRYIIFTPVFQPDAPWEISKALPVMSYINGRKSVEPPRPTTTSYTASTRAVHADDYLQETADVAPAMHVSTTFNYARNPADLKPVADSDV